MAVKVKGNNRLKQQKVIAWNWGYPLANKQKKTIWAKVPAKTMFPFHSIRHDQMFAYGSRSYVRKESAPSYLLDLVCYGTSCFLRPEQVLNGNGHWSGQGSFTVSAGFKLYTGIQDPILFSHVIPTKGNGTWEYVSRAELKPQLTVRENMKC